MLKVLVILVYLLVILCNQLSGDIAIKQDDYCAVSSIIDTKIDGIHNYPIDIFDNSNQSYYDIPYYNCSSTERSKKIHKCALKDIICPIDELDLYHSIKKSLNYNYKHSLCHLRESFHDPNSISNIIILGGSVTIGSASSGCCCNISMDQHCFNFSMVNNYRKLCLAESILCRWSGFITRWFKQLSLGTVNVYNLAIGGSTSLYMSEMFGVLLKDNHISELTSNDIIFIDHSINDGMSFHSRTLQPQLIHGLESLIRRIYHYSRPLSWPTIILLEQWPYVDQYVDVSKQPDTLNKLSNDYLYDYSKIYYKLAINYGIPLWSYRDMIWSNHITNKYTKNTLDYLRFVNNVAFGYQHPPWYIHLYYSDMIAALVKNELLRCIYNQSNILPISSMNASKLIESISHEQTLQCDDVNPPLLDMTAKGFNNHSDSFSYSHIQIGNYISNPLTSWNVIEERKGKIGWITELNSGYIASTRASNLQSIYVSNLTFVFNIPNNNFMKFPHIVRIHYLRTYKNAGVVDVYLCNQYLTTLDSLWGDYMHYHISITQTFSFLYDSNDPTVDDDNNLKLFCHDQMIGLLEFKHKYIDLKSLYEEDLINARAYEKFKVIAVKICPASSN